MLGAVTDRTYSFQTLEKKTVPLCYEFQWLEKSIFNTGFHASFFASGVAFPAV
jgi:hypothetical protein